MPCPPGDQCLDPEWCQQSRDCLRDNDDQIDQLMRAFAYEQGRQDRAGISRAHIGIRYLQSGGAMVGRQWTGRLCSCSRWPGRERE